MHGVVHLVVVDENQYEYGLTACRRDFVWHGGSPDTFEHTKSTLSAQQTDAPHSCLYCAVAPPWGQRLTAHE